MNHRSSAGELSLVDIFAERLNEAADVFTQAFAHDPVIRWFFADYPPTDLAPVRDLFRFSCGVRLARGEPLIGVRESITGPTGPLLGVVGVSLPDAGEWTAELDHEYESLKRRIGPRAAERLDRYDALKDAHRPAALPHFYVVEIGVRPEAQGRGCARALLDQVHRLSAAHPTSAGVALDTENPANISLYRQFGYQVTAQAALDDLPVWYLFRPNDE